MPEADEVAGGARGGGLVVDGDAVRARGARPPGHDRGQPAAQGCRQGRVIVGGGVGDQPVDRGVTDEALRGLRGRRDELQGQARGRRGGGHAVQEGDRAGIPERVREGLGEQHAEHVAAPPLQRPPGRARAAVPQFLRGRQHPPAQFRRQLVGVVVGVGHRHPAHAAAGRHLGQRDPRALLYLTAVHGSTLPIKTVPVKP